MTSHPERSAVDTRTHQDALRAIHCRWTIGAFLFAFPSRNSNRYIALETPQPPGNAALQV